MSRTNSKIEKRNSFAGFIVEQREDSSKLIIAGTPIVYDTPTPLFKINGKQYYEIIARGAIARADTSDVIFNIEHAGRVYARTRNSSLQLRDTEHGLEAIVELDSNDQGHRELYNDIKAGRLDRMSFSFTAADSSFDEEACTITINRIEKLYDVSAVAFPAYDDTTISARCADLLGEHRNQQQGENRSNEREFAIALTLL